MSNIQQFDYSTDLSQALLWHYNKAHSLETLVLLKQLWYDVNQAGFWIDWYTDVFNLDTANDFGLNVWALILGVPMFVNIPAHTGTPSWGFGGFHHNFNRGNFDNTNGSTSGLKTEEKRIVLKLRYNKITSRCDIVRTNFVLNQIFKSFGNVYILDNLDMSITAVFGYIPSVNLRRAIRDYDLIPRADGVLLKYTIDVGYSWGFGPFHQNFNRGNFIPTF
jgi:hypothetical protein